MARIELVGVGPGTSGRGSGNACRGTCPEERIDRGNGRRGSPRCELSNGFAEGVSDEPATIGAAQNFPCADEILDIPMGTRPIASVATARAPP